MPQVEAPNHKQHEQDAVILLKLARSFGLIAHLLEDCENIRQRCLYPINEYTSLVDDMVEGPEIAIANLYFLKRIIGEAQELCESTSSSPLVRKARVALEFTWNAVAQPDVPAKWYLEDGQDGDDERAIECIRDALFRAWERCGGTLEQLEAELGVEAKIRLRPQEETVGSPQPPVTLQGEGQPVLVLGKEKLLSPCEYRAVHVLVEQYPKGLTKDQLGSNDISYLRGLRKRDADWKQVIHFPGVGYKGGYRLKWPDADK